MNLLPDYRATKTLRFRLAMWSAGTMVITAAISIAVVHQAMRWAMSQSLDAMLIEDAEEIKLTLRDLSHESPVLRDEFNRRARGIVVMNGIASYLMQMAICCGEATTRPTKRWLC